jgi:hypothetical protein
VVVVVVDQVAAVELLVVVEVVAEHLEPQDQIG